MNRVYLTLVFFGSHFFHPISLARTPSILQRRKAFMAEYFESCEKKDYVWMPTNFSLVRNDASVHINGVIVVSRDIRDPIALQIRMDRCKDRSDLSSCEHITNIKWPDLCSAVKLVPAIRAFFHALEPPLPCPVKKNLYFVKDAEISYDLVSTFLTTGTGTRPLTKVRCSLFEGHQRVSCLDVGWRIADIKIRA